MKEVFMIVGCLALAGCAGVTPKPSSYGIAMTSRLAQGQYMALHIEGSPACFGEISADAPMQCKSVSQPPRTVKVVWGAPSSWENPGEHDLGVPSGWKIPKGPTRQVDLAIGWLRPPWWFRSGDIMVFTVNRMHGLSVTYQCHRPGHECISYQPVTVYGEPQGVASVASR